MEDSGQHQSGGQDVDVMYIWKIPIDRAYVKSLVGILKVVIAILSLIAFICCASGRSENCDDEYSSTYNFFEFTSISCFLTILFLWFFFVLTLHTRVFFKIIPWFLVELVYLAVYALFYALASIIIAAQSCGKDSNKAAAPNVQRTLESLKRFLRQKTPAISSAPSIGHDAMQSGHSCC